MRLLQEVSLRSGVQIVATTGHWLTPTPSFRREPPTNWLTSSVSRSRGAWRTTESSRTDKRLTPQGYVAAIDLVNLGYKRALNSDLSAVATVSDIFNGQRFQRFATAPTFTQEYRRTVRGRIIYLGLVHSFGAGKKDKQSSFEYDQS